MLNSSYHNSSSKVASRSSSVALSFTFEVTQQESSSFGAIGSSVTFILAVSNEDLSLKTFQNDAKDMNDIIKLNELVKDEINDEPKQAQSFDHSPRMYNFIFDHSSKSV